MNTLKINGKEIRLNDDGFLIDWESWNTDVAAAMAKHLGISDLNKEQIEIIEAMRAYFLKNKVFPILNQVCKTTHQPKECVTDNFVNPELAWKLAGLPKQDNIHFVSMDGETFKMETCC